jgi:hypothetical protein
MGRSAAADVRFDWDGSLTLARRLHALGDQLDELARTRATTAGNALSTWSGEFGTQFADRVNIEASDLARVGAELRGAAGGWAAAWAMAINEQNRRLFARRVQQVEDDRNLLDDIGGFFGGHDDLPPEPSELPVPSPPYYSATGSFVRY